ncbi:MAG: 30S ribosomal protein S1 [Helicobacteraceae bacterium]|jgi:small subunit ribosomal protein S1|nr:30S ribosomal protein S1 [Helicobacteraceae bacterium]
MGNEELEKIGLDDEFGGEDFGAILEKYEKKRSQESGSEKLSEGVIVKISEDEVAVDLGGKAERRLPIDEIKDAAGNLLYKEGDKIAILITSRGGRPSVSHKKALKRQKIAEFIKTHTTDKENPIDIDGKVVSKNKGGYVVEKDGVEFFMPASLAAFKQDAKPVGKSVTARLIKIDEASFTLVLSRRAFLNSQRKVKREAIKRLSGDDRVLPAIVRRIQNYGMFVETEGVEGLVHFTEISHKGPVNPSTYFKEGDEVFVKLIGFDKDKRRVNYSIKATQPNPWREIADQLEVGDTIKVNVANIEEYGAFVDLGNDTEGFLHISEMSWDKNLKHPSEILKVGQEIEVEVIALDVEKQRLRVSLKKLQPKPFEKFSRSYKAGDRVKGTVVSIKEFGAFIRVDGVEGLLHNEYCSWNRGENAKSLFKEGDEVDVEVAKIDADNNRISFSRKALEQSPIEAYSDKHEVGDIVQGTVRDIKNFGVFVRLEEGVDAMIRAEDLAPMSPEEIKVGDPIEATIVGMEPKKGKIRLSVRRLEKQKERDALKNINGDDRNSALGDALAALKK